MEMFPVIILNLPTLLPSVFTKLCLPDSPLGSYVLLCTTFATQMLQNALVVKAISDKTISFQNVPGIL